MYIQHIQLQTIHRIDGFSAMYVYPNEYFLGVLAHVGVIIPETIVEQPRLFVKPLTGKVYSKIKNEANWPRFGELKHCSL